MTNEEKQFFKDIKFWALAVIEHVDKIMSEGIVDEHDLTTFKDAAKSIKLLRRNYLAWDEWRRSANNAD